HRGYRRDGHRSRRVTVGIRPAEGASLCLTHRKDPTSSMARWSMLLSGQRESYSITLRDLTINREGREG
ncbi:MAG TPA: hypothetical protein VFS83_00150, partial [Ktedonobacterales bacterium]|nr:hypothetical protein [Ktedonobacterales bacterium]